MKGSLESTNSRPVGATEQDSCKTLPTANRLDYLSSFCKFHTVTLHLLPNTDRVLAMCRASEAPVDADGAVADKIACRLCVTGGDNAGF